MAGSPFRSLETHFDSVTDPRGPNVLHQLFDILAIAICAVICGADGWVEVEQFGHQKRSWLQQFLGLPNGIPSHDTFGRVFARLDPEEFQASFSSWVQALHAVFQGQVVGLDGKQLRGSKDGYVGKQALTMVSAWASANHLVLGQKEVPAGTNEITIIPELLHFLALEGCIVTLDALGTQEKIATTIRQAEADYILAVKENQGQLYQDLEMLFDYHQKHGFEQAPFDYAQQVNKGHGRLEVRECWTTEDPEYLAAVRTAHKWKDLHSLAMVVAKRITDKGTTLKTRFYISSLPAKAAHLLTAARGHWNIENQLHWVLDVAFREDHSRVRKDHAPANLAVLRHMAVNLLKQEKTAKGGIAAKRKQAGWNEDYLVKVLSG